MPIMREIDEQRDRLTVMARNALAELGSRLDPGSKAQVDEFIDHFEFGVALEWMHAAALDNDPRPLGAKEKAALDTWAAEMGMTLPRDD
jgi:hypothetical protein